MQLLDYFKKYYSAPGVAILAEILKLDGAEELGSVDDLMEGGKVDEEKKAAILERAVEVLLTPDCLASRLSTLSDEEMALFERACQGQVKLENNQREAAHEVQGTRYAFLALQDTDEDRLPSRDSLPPDRQIYLEMAQALKRFTSDILEVPEDVVPIYNSINTPEFHARRRQGFWLTRCLGVSKVLYATTPVSVIARMMEREFGGSFTDKDVMSLYNFLPPDAVSIGYDSASGRFYDKYINDERRNELVQVQADREFYIPSHDEITSLDHDGFVRDTPSLARYMDFLKKYAGYNDLDADEAADNLWRGIAAEDPHQKNLQNMIEWANADYTLSKLMITLYKACVSEVRMPAYCGHTLAEIQAADPDFQPAYYPTGLSELQFQADASTVRVRRNDPCPCGSGKKFKKCCMF